MRLPSGCFGNRLVNCVFTDKDKSFRPFSVFTRTSFTPPVTSNLMPALSTFQRNLKGKICRPFIACVMAMEAGWTDWEKTEEYFVKGKFFKYRQQISLGNRNVHHLFFQETRLLLMLMEVICASVSIYLDFKISR